VLAATALALALAVSASSPACAEGSDGGAGAGPAIAAVWRSAGCGASGPAADAKPDPDTDAIQRGRLVAWPKQHLQFQVPVVPGVKRLVLHLVADDRARGVLDQYLLLGDGDQGAPAAAVVVTDLPRGVDSRDKAFDSVMGLERQLAANSGAYPTFAPVDGPYGESIEMIVPGRTSTACFPTVHFATAARTPGGVPFGISRFAFVGGRLVEFAMALTMPAQMTLEDQHAHARAVMDDFWGGLSSY